MQNPRGVFTSHWSSDEPKKPIDWPAVKAAGYDYAFIKATEGENFVDPKFERDLKEATDAGLLVAPVHYWRSDKNAGAQVKHFKTVAGGLPGPKCHDVEDPRVPHGADLMRVLKDYLHAADKQLSGAQLFYTFPYYLIDRGNPVDPLFDQFHLWISHFTTRPEPMLPRAFKSWTFWQHNLKAKVPGIVGDTCADVFNGTRQALFGLWGIDTPTPPTAGEVELIVPPGTVVTVTERS